MVSEVFKNCLSRKKKSKRYKLISQHVFSGEQMNRESSCLRQSIHLTTFPLYCREMFMVPHLFPPAHNCVDASVVTSEVRGH